MEQRKFDINKVYEYKLLVNLVTDQIFLDRIAEALSPDYFEEPSHAWFIKYLLDYYAKYQKAPTLESSIIYTKTQNLEKRIQDPILVLIMKLFNQDNSNFLDDWEEVQEFSITFCKDQALANAILKSADIVQTNSEHKYDSARQLIDSALAVGMKKYMDIDYDDVEDRKHNKARINITPLPWKAINDKIGGGLGDGEFLTILAPMGAGKTMIGAILSYHFRCMDVPTLLVSLELDSRKIRQRIDALLLNERLSTISAMENLDYDLVQSKIDELPKKGTLRILKLPPTDTTVLTIKNYVKNLRGKGIFIKRIIIDYLDVVDAIDPKQRVKKDWEKFEVVSRDVYSFCSDESVGVIAFVQGNTSSMKDEVITAQSSSGGAKRLHPADLILGYARPDTLKSQDKANLSFIKNRFGKDGFVLPCVTDYDRCQIDIIDSEFYANAEELKTEQEVDDSIKKRYEEFKRIKTKKEQRESQFVI